jgi:predicted short-subunit dehydrogenase-like oxidoreductase (DUF2520 family)
MHPLIAISDPRVGATGLRSAFFCIEGERRALTVARQLVATFGAKVVRIETYRKALYHASAVMAAGHAVALFDLATRMLERCGPDRKVATETLASLFRSATNDLGQRPPPEIMTGPFARGDVATVESHLAILGKEQIPDALAAYIALGTHAIGLAEANGLEREVGLRLRAVLDSSSGSHQ